MRKAPLLMGVLNVTPDSFSDGGRFTHLDASLQHAETLVNEGADIIDIGGESTRPGAMPVSPQEELDRVLPVVEAIHCRLPVQISIDTTKFEVALAAFRAGVQLLNDVSGGVDPRLSALLVEHQGTILLMHRQGEPSTMQLAPSYPSGVVREVSFFLQRQVENYLQAGMPKDRIWVDPGIGFGKTLEQNLQLLRDLGSFQSIGGRLAIGTSRKAFLSQILGPAPATFPDRLAGTLASNLWAYQQGATVFRLHEVGQFRRALKTWERMENGR